jgi:hypothetical protein
MPSSLSARELTIDLLIRYGFQILGALVVLGAGLLLARYVGNLTGRWLERRARGPPSRPGGGRAAPPRPRYAA